MISRSSPARAPLLLRCLNEALTSAISATDCLYSDFDVSFSLKDVESVDSLLRSDQSMLGMLLEVSCLTFVRVCVIKTISSESASAMASLPHCDQQLYEYVL